MIDQDQQRDYTEEAAVRADLIREGLEEQADEQCEGHESLDDAHMGETVFCDGSCRRQRS